MTQIEQPEKPDQPDFMSLLIDGPPWEKKHELGFFVAFIETIKSFLIRPAVTFSVMRRQAGLGDALVYTVALQVFTFLWAMAVGVLDPGSLFPPEFIEMFDLPANISQVMIIAYPVSVILLQFGSAVALHFTLQWRGLQTYDFSLVFRIIAYAVGTAAVLSLLPVLGGLIQIWLTIYLVYIGLRTIYAMEPGSFLITAVLGLFLFFGLFLAFTIGLSMLLFMLSLII